jgi:hypothetical protein
MSLFFSRTVLSNPALYRAWASANRRCANGMSSFSFRKERSRAFAGVSAVRLSGRSTESEGGGLDKTSSNGVNPRDAWTRQFYPNVRAEVNSSQLRWLEAT